ncbi:MAG TPA: C40 family peptidase [Woeseiaceae bacterium]|nr:C40 family peptidase [Woeseiaceae bacterium]
MALAATPLVLAACGGSPALLPDTGGKATHTAAASEAPGTIGERAAAIAVRQVGVPYRYGGRSTDGFDCSGLVNFAYARAGKIVPRTTLQLWRQLHPVDTGDLRVGDVLFFDIEGKVSHVGLYLGRGRFVHAPSSGREVTVALLDAPYYRHAFIRGGRP